MKHAIDLNTRSILDRTLLTGLLIFSWKSVGFTVFNGVDTPLFIVAAIFCLWHLSRGPVMAPAGLIKAWLLWALWILFSDWFSTYLHWGLARDSHWLIWPLLTLICAQHFAKDPASLVVLRYAASGSILAIAVALLTLYPTGSNPLVDPVFGHIRHLAMSVGVLLVWLLDDDGLSKSGRWWLRIGRICGVTILLWSGGRGAVVATALVITLTLWLRPPLRLHWRSLLIELLVALVAAYQLDIGAPSFGFIDGFFRTIGPSNLDTISSARLAMWSKTWSRLTQGYEFWLGAGGNGYMRMGLAAGVLFHPHNFLLQMMTDWGVVGLALAFYLAWWFAQSLRAISLREPAAALGAGTVVFLSFMGSLDGGLYHPQFLVCLAIAIGAWWALGADRRSLSPKLDLSVFPVFLLLALVALHLKVAPLT